MHSNVAQEDDRLQASSYSPLRLWPIVGNARGIIDPMCPADSSRAWLWFLPNRKCRVAGFRW